MWAWESTRPGRVVRVDEVRSMSEVQGRGEGSGLVRVEMWVMRPVIGEMVRETLGRNFLCLGEKRERVWIVKVDGVEVGDLEVDSVVCSTGNWVILTCIVAAVHLARLE